MLQHLSQQLTSVFQKIRGKTQLSDADIQAAMKAIRVALLEADVALPVIKRFIDHAEQAMQGSAIVRSITPDQMVTKYVYDALVDVLGEAVNKPLSHSRTILMLGLQGAGKTTSCGKIARYLAKNEGKKILMASLDVARPGAQQQLLSIGEKIGIPVLPIVAGEGPLAIAKRAQSEAKSMGVDVLLLDSAGRLETDQALMEELRSVVELVRPDTKILVADALTGQVAAKVAQSFHDAIGVDGLIMTRMDGDARGGAILSMRHTTGCPVLFLGTGESMDGLEFFDPKRVAERILGMGDVVGLVEKAQAALEEKDAEQMMKRLQKGRCDFNDIAKLMRMVGKMGGMASILGMLPGMGSLPGLGKLSDGKGEQSIGRMLAIIQSMTAEERRSPEVLNGSRRQRIAKGSGTSLQDVNRVIKQQQEMSSMAKMLGRMTEGGGDLSGLSPQALMGGSMPGSMASLMGGMPPKTSRGPKMLHPLFFKKKP